MFFLCRVVISDLTEYFMNLFNNDGTVGEVAKRMAFCATCCRFDPLTELIFLWPIGYCSGFGYIC